MYLPFQDHFQPRSSTVDFLNEVKTRFEHAILVYQNSISKMHYGEDFRTLKFSLDVSNNEGGVGRSEAVLEDAEEYTDN